MTLARSEQEQDRLQRSLNALSALNLPIFLTDGGSTPVFQEWLAKAPQIRCCEPCRGLVSQVRRSVTVAAAQADFVLYTEPDKLEFFLNELPAFLMSLQTADAPPADLIVLSRNQTAFHTFPAGQQVAERSFNDIASHILQSAPGDLLYGPLCFRAELGRELDTIPDDAGWGWRIHLYVRARLAARQVSLHDGPYACPPEQRGETDQASSLYRVQQLVQNLTALRQALQT